jgi:hypothetical protein
VILPNLDTTKFQSARLIPVTGIKGVIDQERRAASALLAVMSGVPELAIALLKEAGAFRGEIETFIEPEFKINGKKVRPDGLIQITRGQKVWRALVEFKTGKSELDLGQINQYLDIAQQEGIPVLTTVSNEVLDATLAHPTEGIDSRRLRSIKLLHLSWLQIITECIILSEHTGVADTDRDWVLKELIRFLQSDASGASEFNDMGPNWVTVREGIRNGAIVRPDENVLDVVSKFQNLIRYCAMMLAAKTGVNASYVSGESARDDARKFMHLESQKLVTKKLLTGAIKIPGAVANLHIEADIAAGMTHCYFDVLAPKEGRNKSRVNWILRQYKNTPSNATIAIGYKRSRSLEPSLSLKDLISGTVDYDLDNSREINVFRIDVRAKAGTKRGRGQGAFIDSVLDQVLSAYEEALQPLGLWVAAAPKLSKNVKDLLPEIDPDEPESEQNGIVFSPEGTGSQR